MTVDELRIKLECLLDAAYRHDKEAEQTAIDDIINALKINLESCEALEREKSRAYDEGWQAGYSGYGCEADNPYPQGSEQYNSWKSGCRTGMYEH